MRVQLFNNKRLLSHNVLNCRTFRNQNWYDVRASWARLLCEKLGKLSTRSRAQLGFKPSVSVCRVSLEPRNSLLPDWVWWCVITTNKCCAKRLDYRLPQWGAADAEIKVPSGENTELKRSPFKAWSRSVYSHTCYAYCQGFFPCLFLPFRSVHLHFFSKTSPDFSCIGLGHGSCVAPQNKIGHPAGCRFPC